MTSPRRVFFGDTAMRAALLLAACVLCAAHSPAHPPDSEFEVSFGTRKPLGLQLDQNLRVVGFQRVRADTTPPAEANGWIKIGDRLIAVNEEAVERLSLDDVVRKIVKGTTAANPPLTVASVDPRAVLRVPPRS